MSHRMERVNDLLRERVAEIVARELKDPRLDVALLSITEIDTSPDLAQARVRVSMLGSPEEQQDALEALNHSRGYVRRLLKPQLHMKRIPELRFEADTRIADDVRLQRQLTDLAEELPTSGSDAPASPPLPKESGTG